MEGINLDEELEMLRSLENLHIGNRMLLEEFKAPPEWRKFGHEPLGEKIKQYIDETCPNSGGVCDISDRRIIRRIGSESARAMVFHTLLCDGDSACKLLLATEANPESKNLAEIYITVKLGHKYPNYFVKVFTVGKCLNVIIPESIRNNSLIKDAEVWHMRSVILPKLNISKREIKRLEIEYRKTFDRSVYDRYLTEAANNPNIRRLANPDLFKLPALMMCSELGFGDLKYWSTYIRSEDNWRYIIKHVLEALEILKAENITHNDLHHGNILILQKDKDAGVVKIIDFGEHVEEYIPGKDLDYFLQGFNYVENLPPSIKDEIYELEQEAYLLRRNQ